MKNMEKEVEHNIKCPKCESDDIEDISDIDHEIYLCKKCGELIYEDST